MPTRPAAQLTRRLFHHAQGSATGVAAILLLAEALHGRLLDDLVLASQGNDRDMAVIDWEATRTSTGYLSDGERRLLNLADGLATGHPVDLTDILSGLDGRSSTVAINAFAHALRAPNHIFGR